jgi:anion-transporting  ArsA/GET3 family ATPase
MGRGARDRRFRWGLFTYLAAATPGLRELVTIGKIWELAQLHRKVKRGREYDLVVVDAPATGHGVGFLQTPKTFAGIARVGPIASQGSTIHRFLVDHAQAGAILVSLPEEMPVNETARLEADIAGDVGMAVDRIYMNGLYPKRFTGAEIEQIEEAQGRLSSRDRLPLRAALFEHRRAATQKEQLRRLKRQTESDVQTLPFVFEPELGVPQLEQLVEALR